MLQKRRRSLLTLASYGTWDFDLASFPYVYHSLLPNGSEVVKGKVAKIYANGVIENQLVQNGNFVDDSIWQTNEGATFTISNNVATFTQPTSSGRLRQIVTTQPNHKYLLSCKVKTTQNANIFMELRRGWINFYQMALAGVETQIAGFLTPTDTNSYPYEWFQVYTNFATTFDVTNIMCIDLTIAFGTGNEPTTLTDNRIQNLLNRGYIAYNQGEYKGTNVGEIETEPYNLLSLDRTKGTLSQYNPSNPRYFEYDKYYLGLSRDGYYYENHISNLTISNNLVSFHTSQSGYGVVFPIECLPNVSYTLSANVTADTSGYSTGLGISYYDENGMIIGYTQQEDQNTSKSVTFTTPSNCKTVAVVLYGKQEINLITFTNICFHRTGSRTGYAPHKPSASIPFIYQGNGNETNHDSLEITKTEFVFTKEVNYVDSATMPTTLATPQVIRIPRKHLGIVDLGTITTGYVSNGVYYIGGNDQSFGIDVASSNANGYACYCSKFLRANGNEVYNKTNDNTICLTSPFIGNNLAIYSSSFAGKTASEIRALLSGTYLFYETAEEVDDIATRIFTENGGSVTTNSEVLPNIDLDLPVKV